MARIRSSNSKRRSRPSRKNRANRNKKPSKIRINNSKLSNPNKPSRQIRKRAIIEKKRSVSLMSFREEYNEEIKDAHVIHNFPTEKCDKFIKI